MDWGMFRSRPIHMIRCENFGGKLHTYNYLICYTGDVWTVHTHLLGNYCTELPQGVAGPMIAEPRRQWRCFSSTKPASPDLHKPHLSILVYSVPCISLQVQTIPKTVLRTVTEVQYTSIAYCTVHYPSYPSNYRTYAILQLQLLQRTLYLSIHPSIHQCPAPCATSATNMLVSSTTTTWPYLTRHT